MGLEIFLKGAPPWTPRQKAWGAVYCVTMVALIFALIGFNVWLHYSVRRDMPFQIVEASVPSWGNCDGHVLALSLMSIGSDGQLYGTRVCFDAMNFKWVQKSDPKENR